MGLPVFLASRRNFFLGVTHVGCPLFSDFFYCAFMGACIVKIYPGTNGIPSPFLDTVCGGAAFDSLLNNRALCYSTSVNNVCSSDSENFELLFLLILVQKYRMYYTEQLRQNMTDFSNTDV